VIFWLNIRHILMACQARAEPFFAEIRIYLEIKSLQMEDPMPTENARTEEFKVDGERLIGKIKEVIHEGNIRRIIIKDKEGKSILEIPMTFGVVGALIAPQLAAIGAIAALLAEATVVVEKEENQ
jgi:uncharacterized protein DUF4342